MNSNTGDIHRNPVQLTNMVEMELPPTPKQLRRTPTLIGKRNGAIGRVGRNEPCPCGSGKKFKKCCLKMLHEEVDAAAKDKT